MGEMQHIVVCVDDTDDLSKETSTGAVAEALAAGVCQMGGAIDLGVTRHQLLLDERVPYTSHNSAMAFSALLPTGALDAFTEDAAWVVRSMMAASANPGFACGVVPDGVDAGFDELVAFGQAAQREYLQLDDAFALARRIGWLQLRALGGTGLGAIGALAGAGLRLSGNDGRFRGTCSALARQLQCGSGRPVPLAQVQEALEGMVHGTVAVRGAQGQVYAPGTPVMFSKEAKALLRGGAFVLLVAECDGVLWPCTKRELDELAALDGGTAGCDGFSPDNDAEEFGDDATRSTCPNCLYRRRTASGYACVGGALAARQGA